MTEAVERPASVKMLDNRVKNNPNDSKTAAEDDPKTTINREMYLTAQNLQKLQEDINKLFLQTMKYKGYEYEHDPNLKSDYRAKTYRYTYTFGDFFYSKLFHKEFATGMLIALLSGSGAANDLSKYSKYHIEVSPSLGDLILRLYVK